MFNLEAQSKVNAIVEGVHGPAGGPSTEQQSDLRPRSAGAVEKADKSKIKGHITELLTTFTKIRQGESKDIHAKLVEQIAAYFRASAGDTLTVVRRELAEIFDLWTNKDEPGRVTIKKFVRNKVQVETSKPGTSRQYRQRWLDLGRWEVGRAWLNPNGDEAKGYEILSAHGVKLYGRTFHSPCEALNAGVPFLECYIGFKNVVNPLEQDFTALPMDVENEEMIEQRKRAAMDDAAKGKVTVRVYDKKQKRWQKKQVPIQMADYLMVGAIGGLIGSLAALGVLKDEQRKQITDYLANPPDMTEAVKKTKAASEKAAKAAGAEDADDN